MALPNVTINIVNGSLGTAPGTSDGVAGLVITGIATVGIELNQPKQLFSLKDAEDIGLDADYDSANLLQVHAQVKAFYEEAGEGAELWIMLVTDAWTLTDMADDKNMAPLINGASGRIRLAGIHRTPSPAYSPVIVTGADGDVWTAMAKMQATAGLMAAEIKPFRAVVPVYGFDGQAASLPDLRTFSNNRVGMVLLSMRDNEFGAVGLTLGRLASVPVQRNIGRVKDGALSINEAYLTDGIPVEEHESVLNSLHDKGYIIARTYPGKAGYYFNDDPTATELTDDFSSIARGRTIDKAYTLAYTTYVDEVNNEVLINDDGTLEAGYVKELQGKIENVINQRMTANGEISSVKCVIDTAQNILATNQLLIELRIIPVGYTKQIIVNLGFNNPLNQ